MPELPEVETVVRDLRPLLAGRCIRDVRHSQLKLRRPWQPEWGKAIVGARVEAVRRRGKWIVVELVRTSSSGGETRPRLIIHLGMTGQFTVVPALEPLPDHLHLAFELDNQTELRFRDIRRFGSADFHADEAAVAAFFAGLGLGPEPFGVDPGYFRSAFRRTSRNLKAILLDQTILAGVGNIYADEACFRAHLHPGRLGRTLKPEECERLRRAVEEVLARAIEARGSSIRDYVGGSGLQGGFQNEFAVYGRTGEPCTACGAAVKCLRLAGRSSHFCSRCQPRGRARRGVKAKSSINK